LIAIVAIWSQMRTRTWRPLYAAINPADVYAANYAVLPCIVGNRKQPADPSSGYLAMLTRNAPRLVTSEAFHGGTSPRLVLVIDVSKCLSVGVVNREGLGDGALTEQSVQNGQPMRSYQQVRSIGQSGRGIVHFGRFAGMRPNS
jgi:hypothetical protein